MNDSQQISNFIKALTSWYEHGTMLSLYDESDAFDSLEQGKCYDVIFVHQIIETMENPSEFISRLRDILMPGGRILLSFSNRLGIRYFAGDKDIYGNRIYEGIEGYVNTKEPLKGGRLYSRSEISQILDKSGVVSRYFYSVYPGIERAQLLIREEVIPNESLNVRLFPNYENPDTVFLDERLMYDSLKDNNLLHEMANGFLVEGSFEGPFEPYADEVTLQGDRDYKDAMNTIIYKNTVIKRPAFIRNDDKILRMKENYEYLVSHGVPMVPIEVSNGNIVMPYVDGEISTCFFQTVLRNQGKEAFIIQIKEFADMIKKSSESVPYENVDFTKFEPGWEKRKSDDPNVNKWVNLPNGSDEDIADMGIILRKGYIDLVSLNCFHTDEGFQFFDQEFSIPHFPANAIILRTIDLIYADGSDLEVIYPKDELLKDMHLYTHRMIFRKMTDDYISELRGENVYFEYNLKHRTNYRGINANRLRMNHSQEEYSVLFEDIFRDVYNYDIYLFGSGKYAQDYINIFGQKVKIRGILDNNSTKWGMKFNDIMILNPECLKEIDTDKIKVFICIKHYDEILDQMTELGIKHYCVYTPLKAYELPKRENMRIEQNSEKAKPYHIGYVAGVFDLFHIGHLNLLKRAKELCDYLIVGVVTDEQVISDKRTMPAIPFEERLTIVNSIKYVDETVGIPIDDSDTIGAYRRYHFDVQFSGSDYENDPKWLAKRQYLRKHNSDLVFFPYTESTSSTKIKELIDKKLVH